MASGDTSDVGGFSRSVYLTTIFLEDWWLTIHQDGSKGKKKLAVAGHAFQENCEQAVRVFSSAPILKRHDVFTLETVDGIIIELRGFINETRTTENGFPSEVFDHFVFGFPPDWGEYFTNLLEKRLSTSWMGFENSSLHMESTLVEGFSKRFPRNSGNIDDMIFNASYSRGAHDYEVEILENESCESESLHSIVERFLEIALESEKQYLNASVSSKFPVEDGSPLVKLENKVAFISKTEIPCVEAQDNQKDTLRFNCSKSRQRKACVKKDYVSNAPGEVNEESLKDKCSLFKFDGEADILKDVAISSVWRKSKFELNDSSRKNDCEKATSMPKSNTSKLKSISLGDLGQMKDFISLKGTSALTLPVSEVRVSKGVMSLRSEQKFGSGSSSRDPIRYGQKNDPLLQTSEGKNRKREVKSFVGLSKTASKFSEKSASRKKTSRKLAYETPESHKEMKKASTIPPESSSLKRSRSGRVLVRPLAFWRNETAIYDEFGRIIGVNTPPS